MAGLNIRNNFVINTVFSPLINLSENLGFFFVTAMIFSGISAILAYTLGQTYACAFETDKIFNCYAEGWYFYLFLKFVLLSIFTAIWYAAVYRNEKIDKEFLLHNYRWYGRNFVILCGFVIINFIPVISIALLIFREPNPNWIIELIYFTVVSVGFTAPFILMRFYGLVADLIAGEGWKNAGAIWSKGSGNGLKIVLSSAIIFMICVILFFGMMNFLKMYVSVLSLPGSLLYDIVFNFLTYLIFAVVIGYFEAMRRQLLK